MGEGSRRGEAEHRCEQDILVGAVVPHPAQSSLLAESSMLEAWRGRRRGARIAWGSLGGYRGFSD